MLPKRSSFPPTGLTGELTWRGCGWLRRTRPARPVPTPTPPALRLTAAAALHGASRGTAESWAGTGSVGALPVACTASNLVCSPSGRRHRDGWSPGSGPESQPSPFTPYPFVPQWSGDSYRLSAGLRPWDWVWTALPQSHRGNHNTLCSSLCPFPASQQHLWGCEYVRQLQLSWACTRFLTVSSSLTYLQCIMTEPRNIGCLYTYTPIPIPILQLLLSLCRCYIYIALMPLS